MLNNEELLNIYGGAINIGIISIVIAGIVFLVGVIDGIITPKSQEFLK